MSSTPAAGIGGVRIDDLAAPRLPAQVTALRDQLAGVAASLSLTPERVTTTAVSEAGLDDFGDRGFLEPLSVLCTALREEGGLSPLGVVVFWAHLVRLLKDRLLIAEMLRPGGQPGPEPVSPPIVVAGLWRSGAARLASLLARDPHIRHLSHRDVVQPVPGEAGRFGARAGSTDPAYAGDIVAQALPRLGDLEEAHEHGPQPDLRLDALSFRSLHFETQTILPAYRDWYRAADQRPAYQFLRGVLQILGRTGDGTDPCLLAGPHHLGRMAALLETFPGAVMVVVHRDPVPLIAYAGLLGAYRMRLVCADVDPAAAGRYWADRIDGLLGAYAADRARLRPGRLVDITHAELARDPRAVLDKIYAAIGRPVPGQLQGPVPAAPTATPVLCAPAELGLDLPELNARHHGYREQFGVPAEDPGEIR